jgi:hypothetical protein
MHSGSLLPSLDGMRVFQGVHKLGFPLESMLLPLSCSKQSGQKLKLSDLNFIQRRRLAQELNALGLFTSKRE